MIDVQVHQRRSVDASAGVRRGVQKRMMDAASQGFSKSQEAVASNATDTGHLLQSGYPPVEESDGTIRWGYTADYAKAVEEGSRPHWPPIQPLLGWARRVLGNESAAYAVQQKIAREGTNPVGFVARGVDAMKASLRAHGLASSVRSELR